MTNVSSELRNQTSGVRIPSAIKTILYAEDDENYALLMQSAFREGGFTETLRHVQDGAEAMAYIKGEGQYANRDLFPFPAFLLVDLKMPRVNGLELLNWIRRQSPCPHLPVVVLTCSDELKDVKMAYQLGANSFLVKPVSVEDLKEMMKAVDQYWLRHNIGEEQSNRRYGLQA